MIATVRPVNRHIGAKHPAVVARRAGAATEAAARLMAAGDLVEAVAHLVERFRPLAHRQMFRVQPLGELKVSRVKVFETDDMLLAVSQGRGSGGVGKG